MPTDFILKSVSKINGGEGGMKGVHLPSKIQKIILYYFLVFQQNRV